MAIAAVALVASAGAVAAGVVTVSTLATISTVVTVVGAVTKSKELMQLGAGMGLASLGSGLLSAASEAGTVTAANAADAAGGLNPEFGSNAAYDSAISGAGDVGATTGTVTNAADGVAQYSMDAAVNPAAAELSAPIGEGGGSSIVSEARNGAGLADAGGSTMSGAPAAESGLAAPDVSTPADVGVQGAQGPAAVQTPYGAGDQLPNETAKFLRQDKILNSQSFFGKAFDWMEKNKTLTAAGLNLAGGALKGLGDSRDADRAYDLRKSISDRETANANAQPTVNFTVNSGASVYPSQAKQYAGIVSSARR